MAISVQLDLFSKNDDFSLLLTEIGILKKECSNVRRGIFSRLDVVKKEMTDLIMKQQVEIELLRKKIENLDFDTLQKQAM